MIHRHTATRAWWPLLATAMLVSAAAGAAEVASPTAGDPSSYPAGLETIPSDAQLESSGAVIGEILIDNQNIFDPQDPREDRKLFRLANRLHIKTRGYVVRDQLLFHAGDPFS